MAITLPYEFDTYGIWRTILKGAIGMTTIVALSFAYTLLSRQWPAAGALALSGALLVFFTRALIRFQSGAAGTLRADAVVVRPNELWGFTLPGPAGIYPLNRFSGVRIEFRSGPVDPSVQGGPNEVVWLVGRTGTPNIALARTQRYAGRALGQELGSLLGLPVEEVGAPKRIEL
jgi:hypothetical protein